MFFKNNLIFISIFLTIGGIFVAYSRKYFLTKIGVNALTLIDIFLTNSILIAYIFSTTTFKNLKASFKTLSNYDILMSILVSAFIAFGIIIGRNILLNNSLSRMVIIQTIIRVLLTIIFGYFIYNEKLTYKKIAGIFMILLGISLIKWD